MRRRPFHVARVLAPLMLIALASCGDPNLWARWRAERDLWHAERAAARVRIRPGASDQDLERAGRGYLQVMARWPAAKWAERSLDDPLARDVARVSGTAAIRMAGLEARGGRTEQAVRSLSEIEQSFVGVWPVPLTAALARSATLESAGHAAAARAVDESIARRYPVVGPVDGASAVDRDGVSGALEAAIRVREWHAHAGRRQAADSAARAQAAVFDSALATGSAGTGTPRLLMALAGAQAADGTPAGRAAARRSLQRCLAERGAGPEIGEALLRIAGLALESAQPDSAIVYARWALRDYPTEHGLAATRLEVAAWLPSGQLDSALAAYGRFVDQAVARDHAVTAARIERAALLERTGKWDEARVELHTVIASDPNSPEAFAAMERLVAHHAERNEPELAALELRWCLERLDRTFATVLDPAVLLDARRARARLLMAAGNEPAAYAALVELWREAPADSVGTWAGFQAAELAERRLGRRAEALQLYQELAERAGDPTRRHDAALQVRRLTGTG